MSDYIGPCQGDDTTLRLNVDDLFELVKARYGELCEVGYTVAFCLGGKDRFFKCFYKDAVCFGMNNESIVFMETDYTGWIGTAGLNDILNALIEVKKQSDSFVESIDQSMLIQAVTELIHADTQANLHILRGRIIRNMLMYKFNVPTGE